MAKYVKKPTAKTPRIVFDYDNGVFEFSGRSIPENSNAFFGPIKQEVESYLEAPRPVSILRINFEYINTSSAKCFVELLRCFEKCHNNGTKVSVLWYNEKNDEDMRELGEDLKEILKLPFEFIEMNH